MRTLILLSLMLFAFKVNAQRYQHYFTVEKKIFKVVFLLKDTTVLTTQIASDTAKKVAFVFTEKIVPPKNIFKQVVENAVASILNDTVLINQHAKATEEAVEAIFDKLVKQVQEDEKTRKENEEAANDDTKIIYGADEYLGLTAEQKEKLIQNLKELDTLQAKRYMIWKNRPVKRLFWLIKIDSDTVGKYLDSNQYRRIKQKVKEHEYLVRDLKKHRQHEVAIIGNANVVTSFKIADKSQINGGLGIIVTKPRQVEFIGIFTISQASDTIMTVGKPSEDFGTSVLIPGVRKFSLLTSYRIRSLWPHSYSDFWNKFGLSVNFNITPYNWQIRNVKNDADSLNMKIIPIAMDIMVPFGWVNMYNKDNDIYISTDLGLTARYLAGNHTADMRQQFLGRGDAFYAGFIAGITIRYNGLRLQYHAPFLFGSQVEGLTNGQAYASISFVTNIISKKGFDKLFTSKKAASNAAE